MSAEIVAGQAHDDTSASNRRVSTIDAAIAEAEPSLEAVRSLLFPAAEAFDALVENKALERRAAYGPNTTVPPLNDLRDGVVEELHLRYLSGAQDEIKNAVAKVTALRATFDAIESEALAAPRPSLHPGGAHAHDRQAVETFGVKTLLAQQVAQADLEGRTAEELVTELERATAAKDVARAYVADRLARRAIAAYVPEPEALASLPSEKGVARLSALQRERDALLARMQAIAEARLSPGERQKLADAKARVRAAEQNLADLKMQVAAARRANRVAVSRPAIRQAV